MDPALHQQVIAELDKDIADLQGQLGKAQAAREWHASHLNGNVTAAASKPAQPALALSGLSQPDAIRSVFLAAKRPLRGAEVVDALVAGGFKTDRKRAVLMNWSYTTMKRRNDLFAKQDDGSWVLIELQNDKQPDEQ